MRCCGFVLSNAFKVIKQWLSSCNDSCVCRSLIAPVRDLLAVRAVWHDTSVEQATQRFALWAAKLLESRHEVAEKLEACGIGGPRPPVQRSLFLHSEPGGRAVEALSSRTLLQVRFLRYQTMKPKHHAVHRSAGK
jgi:hypothetical protein